MAVTPANTNVAISSLHDTRDDKHREQDGKKPSKNKKDNTGQQARQELSYEESQANSTTELQLNSQPVDTEKVIELLAQKQEQVANRAKILELSGKNKKNTNLKKIDKHY